MSLYVRVLNSFYSHRKTMRLKLLIGDDAYWIPPRLWAYASERQPDGVFENYTSVELAMLLGYTKHGASRMLQALTQAGFMDSDPVRIHGWAEHNRFHVDFAARAKSAADARWSKERERIKEREYVHKREGEGVSIAQACPKHAPSMLQASRNGTPSNGMLARSGSFIAEKDALEQAGKLLVKEEFSALCYADWVENGCCNAKGNPRDWKTYVAHRWRYEREDWNSGTHSSQARKQHRKAGLSPTDRQIVRKEIAHIKEDLPTLGVEERKEALTQLERLQKETA